MRMLNANAMVRGKSIELGYVMVDQIWLIRMYHIEGGDAHHIWSNNIQGIENRNLWAEVLAFDLDHTLE